jgi:ABC-2 type transport system ATP-binding protein
MSLLGATTPAILKTTARVDQAFALRSFDFSLDPGTGPLTLSGRLDGLRLTLQIQSAAGSRTEVRTLDEPPLLMLNLGRRLASAGLADGVTHRFMVFEPATLSNAVVTVRVGRREVVMTGGRPTPAFRAELSFAGITTTSWVTDTGEVIREESPLGLLSVREPQEQATQLAVSSRVQADLLAAAAVVPTMRTVRIDEPRDVARMRLELRGVDASTLELDGVGQSWTPDVLELTDVRRLRPGPADPDVARYLTPEPLIESDDPAIVAEAARMTAGAATPRERAERLVRGVNGLLEKAPTISVPSAREVLRTKVGDCNEHTALYVALARAAGLPTRINVGLAYVLGAFYYHAWPEVYLAESDGRGLWLPVDPTFNQFPADATHIPPGGDSAADRPRSTHRRRSGAVRRRRDPHCHAGHAGSAGTTAGAAEPGIDGAGVERLLAGALPRHPVISVQELRKQYGEFTAVDGISLEVPAGQIHGFLGPNGAGKTTTIRMIAGLLKPSAGRILVDGHDLAATPEAAKAALGFIPDRPFIYEKLTAGEFLRFHGGLYGMDVEVVETRIGEMLDLFELGRWRDELVESFSHGMKQRLVMSAAFLHRPKAVLVDEPMVGLDPRGARLIKEVFRAMAARGVAILMSTHTLEVAEEMCDRISIILKGRIIAGGTVDEVRVVAGAADEELTAAFLKLTGGSGLQEIDEVI